MKIIRWLLSHFFLILLIVIVIYSYMFWGNLAGENTPAGKAIAYLSGEFREVRDFVDAVKARQQGQTAKQDDTAAAKQEPVPVAAVAPAKQTAVEPAAEPVEEKVAEKAAEEATEKAVEQVAEQAGGQAVAGSAETAASGGTQDDTEMAANDAGNHASEATAGKQKPVAAALEVPPVSISYQYRQAQITRDASGKTQVRPAAGAGATVADSGTKASEDKFVPEETVRQLDKVDRHGHLITASAQPTEAVRKAWILARKSYYLRNYVQSEKSYREVIANTEDNFDAYGELGNVYFNQGKKQQAAEAYFEAASILVRKGQVQRARSLIGLMRHLDPERAKKLKKLIDSAES